MSIPVRGLLAALLLWLPSVAHGQWTPSGAGTWTPPDPATLARLERETLPVGVVSSTVNQKAFQDRQLDYRGGVKAWLTLLGEMGISYRLVGDYELETGLKPMSALILHHADRLSDRQLANIRAFHEAGAPVIIAGLAGRYSREGEARSLSLPELWLGLQSPRPFVPRDMASAFLAVRASSPLSLAVEPGFRFELQWQGSFWYGTSDDPAAFVTDWSLNPIGLPAKNPNTSTIALLRVTPRARLAWTGFSPDGLVMEGGDRGAQGRAFFETLVRWTLDRPVIAKPHWPEGRIAAAVISTGVLDEICAEFAALLCHEEGVRATFFVQGKVARERPDLLGPLAENGEIGNTSYYNEEDETIRGRPLEEQEKEIGREVRFLAESGVARIVGYTPPLGEYDDNTLRAAARAGLEFFFGNSEFDRLGPVLLELDGLRIHQFVRTAPDAYGVVKDEGAVTPETYAAAFRRHATRIFELGGIFTYIFHVNYEDQEINAASIKAFLAWLREQPVWLTTFGGVLEWQRQRDAVVLHLDPLAAGREITLANPTAAPVAGFPLVYVPSTGASVLLENPPPGVLVRPREPFGYL
ncbi:MAG: polysaccharide deacetylase family protein, partial [Deltaproteobacteria bacterium]|nr:polysaccharide deacetylase family protein [Deltaproteobacteria bacterium]